MFSWTNEFYGATVVFIISHFHCLAVFPDVAYKCPDHRQQSHPRSVDNWQHCLRCLELEHERYYGHLM
jgi:hypothetical protein